MSVKTLCFVVVLWVMGLSGVAQINSAAGWVGMEWGYKWNKKWKSELEFQGRFDLQGRWDAPTYWINNAFVAAKISRKITKWYELSLGYRNTQFLGFGANRIELDQVVDQKFDKHKLQGRVRLQRSWDEEQLTVDRIRIRCKYEYKISKKLLPFVFVEGFFTRTYNYSNWNKIRYGLGSDVRLRKNNYISIFTMLQQQIQVKNPEVQWVMGLVYSLKSK